jgi:hypothetical protein
MFAFGLVVYLKTMKDEEYPKCLCNSGNPLNMLDSTLDERV